MPWMLLADVTRLVHLGVVLFVVLGLVWIVAGHRRGWPGARTLRLRVLHAATIGVVVAESWLGWTCPLTTLEWWLRAQAGQPLEASEGFIAYWAGQLLYWDFPPWVFTLAYTAFGALVAWAWWRHPPGPPDDSARGLR
jgi:hypothetical protein